MLVMDEQPVQLFKETRRPIPATRHHPKRVDYEYDRAGVANIFMVAEPLSGWRRVFVRQQKTKIDWAQVMREVLEENYSDVKKVVLVCDNLNTHTWGAFYETYEPALARSLARRVEFVLSPKHGSWLNIAENELSTLSRQCVKGVRLGTIEELRKAVEAWAALCNDKQKEVLWQFNCEKARIKLHSLYPKIKN